MQRVRQKKATLSSGGGARK